MSHSFKKTPAGTIGSTKPGTGRYFKRLKAKRERARVRVALLAGTEASFLFTPPSTYDIGDGKTYYGHARAGLMRK
jgi:hypothetical protein